MNNFDINNIESLVLRNGKYVHVNWHYNQYGVPVAADGFREGDIPVTWEVAGTTKNYSREEIVKEISEFLSRIGWVGESGKVEEWVKEKFPTGLGRTYDVEVLKAGLYSAFISSLI